MATHKDLTDVLWVYRVDCINPDRGSYRLMYVHADELPPRDLKTYTLTATDELDAWVRFKGALKHYRAEFRSLG